MRRIMLSVLAALWNGGAQADDWGHLHGYVQWTSDYRFYGMSWCKPALVTKVTYNFVVL